MEKVKVIGYSYDEIITKPIADRLYELFRPTRINIFTEKDGVISYEFDAGFIFDARSGGKAIDWLIPHIGSQSVLACWLAHDGGFYPHTLDFKTANDILRQMYVLATGQRIRASLIDTSVTLCGKSHKSYEISQIEKKFKDNVNKYRFWWGGGKVIHYGYKVDKVGICDAV